MLEVSKIKDGFKIIGEVDIATSDEFQSPIVKMVESGAPTIKLDLSDMEYIDSTGIGILMNIRRNILRPGQQIILVAPKRSIQKLFQLTGVDQIFKIEK